MTGCFGRGVLKRAAPRSIYNGASIVTLSAKSELPPEDDP